MPLLHRPVLLKESIQTLNIKPEGIYVDATLGRCGHSTEILHQLGKTGRLFAFDQDQAAITYGQQHFKGDPRVTLTHANFSSIPDQLKMHRLRENIDGILFDLGVCTTQIDDPKRGFSFRHRAPLDMRMDQRLKITAADILRTYSEKKLVTLLQDYGEEWAARPIAKAIHQRQKQQAIQTTTDLVNTLLSVRSFNTKKKIHPATKTFQALRIAVNQELTVLKNTLPAVINCLAPKGRLTVISFHSLEDRIVKRCFRDHSRSTLPNHIPIKYDKLGPKLEIIGRALKPSAFEIKFNPGARSAILRVAERTQTV